MGYDYKIKRFQQINSLIDFLNAFKVPKDQIIEIIKDNKSEDFILIYITKNK